MIHEKHLRSKMNMMFKIYYMHYFNYILMILDQRNGHLLMQVAQ